MIEIFERLWNEYFAEECALIETEEERKQVKKVKELRRLIDELLTQDQEKTIEKYIEAMFEMQASFVKKSFFKGCKFATGFLLEMMD